MQACAESDDAALKSQPPRPALEKLKQLAEVGRVLRQRKYHETFLASKGLNAMARYVCGMGKEAGDRQCRMVVEGEGLRCVS
jgi:hypothetical protein